ncbi:cobalt-zinc-cadmium efflux system outer membrane protein [Myroides gitamensis]|uniref:TolC family protein n=1 Tax=Myroides odoratus TaxID=256 RepID=UPI002168B42C|nr:TolC family protein [Myroides odoratus]MCS4239036.1 cobalt-zinc-cadmium efflux system outer membrane protein [Myroides odoratus]MDH6599705.1 cobalt-zinc-cadmium efflux system outer membrane protein [Myroides gitamensis]
MSKMFRRVLTLSILVLSTCISQAQEKKQALKLSKEEIETLFLEQNLDLLAKKLEISQAEAQLIQARLWPNPTFEISEVNVWRTTDIEEQPIIFGNWGTSQQISLHLEQEIETAGKRRKRIDLQKLSIEERQTDFEIVLRESKLSLRNTLTSIQVLQQQQEIYQKQIDNTNLLITGYKNQLNQGNISQSEYIRLKAAQLQFKKELVDVSKELEEALKELKNFINIGTNTPIYVTNELEIPTKLVSELQIEDWIIHAQENRPDIMLNDNLINQAKKQVEIEKAERTPNITLGVDYDRGGNIMRDFVGFGLSFDLPIFDRNKGNIKEAKLGVQIAELEAQNKKNEISNDIIEALRNYTQAQDLYNQIDADYELQLDRLLEAYVKNFQKKNVSMIEYLDFVEAYVDNKNILLETKKELNEQLENLQFAIGKDI